MRALFLAAVVTTALACTYPDGIDKKLYLKTCDGVTTENIFKVNSVTLRNPQGQADYPVNLNESPIHITGSVSVGGSKTYTGFLVSITLNYFGGLFGCKWHSIPTFGLLNNLPEGDGGNPVSPGTITLNTTFPIGKYSKILDLIPKNTALRADVLVQDKDTKAKLVCETAELLVTH